MKIKLYREIYKLGKAGEEVNVTSEIGNRLLCQGRAAVISHGSPPQDAMVSKLVAPPPQEDDEPLKVVVVPGDSPNAPEQKSKANKPSPDKSSNKKRKQKRTEKS